MTSYDSESESGYEPEFEFQSRYKFEFESDSDYEENQSAAMSLGMLSQHNRKYIKELTNSDVNGQDRLMLNGDFVEQCVLPLIDAGKAKLSQSPHGVKFIVWDADDETLHDLCLRKYTRKSPYVLNGLWRRNFVQRKGLKKGDTLEISFFDGIFIINLIPRKN